MDRVINERTLVSLLAAGALLAPFLTGCDPLEAMAQQAAEAGEASDDATVCEYRTYEWNSKKGRAVNRRKVSKPYSEVTDDERSPEEPRCSVCLADQTLIDPAELGIEGVDPFRVCHVYADDVKSALETIANDDSFEIEEIDGYRAGKTRGPLTDEGLRTKWSNHSFGTAIDINKGDNGIYSRCNIDEVTVEALEDCRLGLGGEWNPKKNPRTTITKDSVAYKAFTKFWKWGGEISGRTRDMMHFSPTGH